MRLGDAPSEHVAIPDQDATVRMYWVGFADRGGGAHMLASICARRYSKVKKCKPPETSLDRYDWSRARRGRWAGRLHTAKVVLLRPEIYELFW
jgi:hypothetical protein